MKKLLLLSATVLLCGNVFGQKIPTNNKKPVDKSVRVVWIVPKDMKYDAKIHQELEQSIINVQEFYGEQLNGESFRLNDPIVEVLKGDHDAQWYYDTPFDPNNTEKAWNTLDHAIREVGEKLGRKDWDENHKWVIYISAEGSGAASRGATVITQHDIEGLLGNPRPRYKNDMGIARWWGGMAHELGHCFALPDIYKENSLSIMGDAGFFMYPNSTLSKMELDILYNNPKNKGFFTKFPLPFSDHKEYKIINKATGKALTASDRGDRSKANVISQQEFTGDDKQIWKIERLGDGYYRIMSKASNYELAMLDPGNRADDPLSIKCSNYYNRQTHQWSFMKYRDAYMIMSMNGQKAIGCEKDSDKVQKVIPSTDDSHYFIIEPIN